MEIAKVFTNGGSQAVRLPKNCRFDTEEVITNKIGKIVILMPKGDTWSGFSQGLEMFTDDYLSGSIKDLPLQERPGL